jgi:hypothetical protein
MTTTNSSTTDLTEKIARAEENVRTLSDKLAAAKAQLRELRGQNTKTKNAPRECTCGCGGITSGGLFLPGHDARMRSRLLREIRDGATPESERAALAELAKFPGLMHNVGEWDLGRDRKEREAKDIRKAQAEQDRTARKTEAERLKAAAQALRDRSRKEQNETAEAILAQKERAIADAKAQGTRTVPQAK